MTADAIPIDVDSMPPTVSRLVHEVAESGRPRVFREGGADVALLIPINSSGRARTGRRTQQADLTAFLATAGGWSGLVDAAKLKREIKAARSSRRQSPRF